MAAVVSTGPASATGLPILDGVRRQADYWSVVYRRTWRGTVVTSFYDWSDIDPEWRKANIFPVVPESALRATLGILDRTVRRGYPRG